MEFIKNEDLQLIQDNGSQEVDDITSELLKAVYSKLEYLCLQIAKKGFEFTIRKDPRKQAGPGKFLFQDYQWAKVFPRGMKSECDKKFGFIIGLSDSLHFHMMGISDFQKHLLSDKASKESWTEIELQNSNYEKVSDEFVNFANKNMNLFLKTGAKLGIEICKNKLAEMENESIIKLLKAKKQIILQGPPGTGKTYNAKEIASEIILEQEEIKENFDLDKSERFKLVQFHPSYTYEDFVRGIIAISKGPNVEYLTVNKVLAEFAAKAHQNLIDSKKEPAQITHEQWVNEQFEDFKDTLQEQLDENDGSLILNVTVNLISIEHDAFRYTGNTWRNEFRMKFRDILTLYLNNIRERRDIKHEETISPLGREHSTYFKLVLDLFYQFMENKVQPVIEGKKIARQDFVLVIDEMNRANLPAVLGELIYALEYRNQKIETMYEVDGDKSLILPENLLIIGTMNKADRSVSHIDYAIRRRFSFVNILPNENVIRSNKGQKLFKEVSELFVVEDKGVKSNSDFLTPDFNFEDVQIGHSYFMGEESQLEMWLDYEIKPILLEYVKDGILTSDALIKIKDLRV
jgi:MoxR-like ATPase